MTILCCLCVFARRKWIEYFGVKYGRLTIATLPHYTTSDCPNCGKRIKKSLSTRTHICSCGIEPMDRDYAASLNILKKATQGHWGSWSDEILDLNAWGDPICDFAPLRVFRAATWGETSTKLFLDKLDGP